MAVRPDPQADDVFWMRKALELADKAAQQDEVPVGAVLVCGDELLGQGWNQVIGAADPTAHAECVALRAAAAKVQNYRLPDTTLYVTLEPCTMCVGAMLHARVKRLVFATREPRAGVVVSQGNALEAVFYNHSIDWHEGVLAAESRDRLQAFFRNRR